MCLPDDSKFQIYSGVKLDKGTSVTYGSSATDAQRNNSRLYDWLKVLPKKVLQLSIEGIFHVGVDGKEVFVIDEYVPFAYEIFLEIEEKRINFTSKH